MKSLIFKAVLCSFLPIGVWAATPRLPANHIPVPIVPQATSYSCGAAALLGVLYYWQVYDGAEADLFKMTHTTPANGTEPHHIAEAARKFGLQAVVQENLTLQNLANALARGGTVILELQAWRDYGLNRLTRKARKNDWENDWDDGHYIVLVGMDQDFIYGMDPSSHGGYGYIPLQEFLTRWHDVDKEKSGRFVKHVHLGIFIKGRRHIPHGVERLIPIE